MNISGLIIDFANKNKNFNANDLLENLSPKVDISKKGLSWHLCKLVHERKIFRTGRGQYTIESKQLFHPIPNAKTIKLYKKLKEKFPLLPFCIYNGEILADLQHHLSYNNNIYVETERYAAETIFHFLQKSDKNTFFSPTESLFSDYIHLDNNSIIVKPLVSESPLQEINGVKMPKIEKILVDIQCDKDFFYLQGQESIYIMDNAFYTYAVNKNQLMRYAGRRGIKPQIEKYLKANNL